MFIVLISLVEMYSNCLFFLLFILLYLLFFPVIDFDFSHLFCTVLLLSDLVSSLFAQFKWPDCLHIYLFLGPVYTWSLNVFSLIG